MSQVDIDLEDLAVSWNERAAACSVNPDNQYAMGIAQGYREAANAILKLVPDVSSEMQALEDAADYGYTSMNAWAKAMDDMLRQLAFDVNVYAGASGDYAARTKLLQQIIDWQMKIEAARHLDK